MRKKNVFQMTTAANFQPFKMSLQELFFTSTAGKRGVDQKNHIDQMEHGMARFTQTQSRKLF